MGQESCPMANDVCTSELSMSHISMRHGTPTKTSRIRYCDCETKRQRGEEAKRRRGKEAKKQRGEEAKRRNGEEAIYSN